MGSAGGAACAHEYLHQRWHPAHLRSSCPASSLGEMVVGAYDDPSAVLRFVDGLDAATYEFENVPASTIAAIAERVPTAPGPRSLATSQDRIAEKEFFRS